MTCDVIDAQRWPSWIAGTNARRRLTATDLRMTLLEGPPA
jgi:hypothetical protein